MYKSYILWYNVIKQINKHSMEENDKRAKGIFNTIVRR